MTAAHPVHQTDAIHITTLPPFVPQDQPSAEMVDQLLQFATRLCSASSAIFFWVGPRGEITAPQMINIREENVAHYNEAWAPMDPIHVNRLKDDSREVAVLSHVRRTFHAAAVSEYADCLRQNDVGDEVALVFYRDRDPIASLSLFRSRAQRHFSIDGFDWDALRNLALSSLGLHWRVRSLNVAESLTHYFGLKARELEVVSYVLRGKSNQQIADILGISLQTVKSHIVSILNKTGVDSRLGIACLVHGLECRLPGRPRLQMP
jgi:DNA-binding CsgD family transcriptional regulator